MNKHLFKIASLLFIFSFVIMGLTGCKDKKEELETSFKEASAVTYNREGLYQTEIKDINGVKLTSNDIKINYQDINPLTKAVNKFGYGDFSYDLKEENALVKSVSEKDNNLIINFLGKSPNHYPIDCFVISIPKIKVLAVTKVNYPTHELSCNLKSVNQNSKNFDITLSLEEGSFNPNITKEMLELDLGFKNLKIHGLSNSEKNLSFKLTGSLADYSEGSIMVLPMAIKDASGPASISIGIESSIFELVPSSLKKVSDLYHVNLVINDLVNPETLTINDIKIDQNIFVSDLIKHEDFSELVLDIKDAKDVNEAAKILSKAYLSVKDYSIRPNFEAASIYPVFDYVELNDDMFDLTLLVYSENGKFNPNLEASMFSFEEDFTGAKLNSFEFLSEEVLELKLSVPSLGQTEDTMDLYGVINLEANALINPWGSKSDPVSNARSYSQDSLGKDFKELKPYQIVKKIGLFEENYNLLSDIAKGDKKVEDNLEQLLILSKIGDEKDPLVNELVDFVKNEFFNLNYIIRKSYGDYKAAITTLNTSFLFQFINLKGNYHFKSVFEELGTIYQEEKVLSKDSNLVSLVNKISARVQENQDLNNYVLEIFDKISNLLYALQNEKRYDKDALGNFEFVSEHAYNFNTSRLYIEYSLVSLLNNFLNRYYAIYIMLYKDTENFKEISNNYLEAKKKIQDYLLKVANIVDDDFYNSENPTKIYCSGFGFYTTTEGFVSRKEAYSRVYFRESDGKMNFYSFRWSYSRDAIEGFIRRMNKRTLAEEFLLAGINTSVKKRDDKGNIIYENGKEVLERIDCLVLNSYSEKVYENDVLVTKVYADIIPIDSNTPQYNVLISESTDVQVKSYYNAFSFIEYVK